MGRIKVRFRQSRDLRDVFGYALEVHVVSSDGIPGKIFVYHQSPSGMDGNTISEFDHVASPVDFQEIPEDAASEIVPWFRTDTCVAWFRFAEDLDVAKQLFIDDIQLLQKSYDILSSTDDFVNENTLEFSNGIVRSATDDSSSSGGSDSDSSSSF